MAAWRSFHVSVTFRAPLGFSYAWCTDYTPQDGKYAGEDRTLHLQRRIIKTSSRQVVFENLYDVGKGWGWERHVVTLLPPNRWHCEGKGNQDEAILDYELRPLSKETTRFDMRWKSRPIGSAHGRRTPASIIEEYVTKLWKKRAGALEHEYRKSNP
jgi:hypothetical protein